MMRPVVLAVIAGIGFAAGFAASAPSDAATLVKKQKAPKPVGKKCPTAWYYYKGRCIPYGRSWYGAPSYLYYYGPGIRFRRPHGGGRH
jgi:hypothetical protein